MRAFVVIAVSFRKCTSKMGLDKKTIYSRTMKRSVVSEITVIFCLLLFGNAVSMDFQTPWDLCENNTIRFSIADSLTLTENWITGPSIRCIYINTPNVNIMEGAFNGLPNLTYLNMNDFRLNNLNTFPTILNLRALTLTRSDSYTKNILSLINAENFPQLEYLDLSHYFIGELGSNLIYSLSELTHLNLSRNSIQFFLLDGEMGHPLRILDISYNMLSQCSLSNLNNLSSLILNNNKFENIGYGGLDLINLKSLKNLSVVGNTIQTVNSGVFDDLVNLEYLDLSMNRLRIFNSELHLTSLKVLVLDYNYLSDIPTGLFPNLTTLSLNCNNIGYLMSSSFCDMPHLITLFLKNNNITEFPVHAFKDTKLLEELDLSDNRLSYMPAKWCQSLTKLWYLDLSRNNFTSFDSVFSTCPTSSIKQLYLKGNPITYFKARTLQIIPKDTIIYVNMGEENEDDTSCTLMSSPALSGTWY